MWNDNSPRLAGKQAVASDVAASPSIAKRQRRPSVRLEELGIQQPEKAMPCLPVHDVGSPANSTENLRMSIIQPNDFKSPYRRPRAHGKNDLHLKGLTPDADEVSSYAQDLTRTNASLASHGEQMQQSLTRKKGRGGKVPRVPTLATLTKKVTSVSHADTSVRGRRKAKSTCMQAAEAAGKENNAHSSVAFIASAYNSASTTSDESTQEGDMQHSDEMGDFLPAQAKAVRGRSNRRVQASSRTQAIEVMDDAGGRLMNGSACGPRGKLVVMRTGRCQGMQSRLFFEATRGGDSMERSEPRILHTSHCPWPLGGVKEWLQSLGLGKYAKLFEAHEVEPEVLPLLTFEDLREMGVLAIGPRRKIFSAIQQGTMAMLPEA